MKHIAKIEPPASDLHLSSDRPFSGGRGTIRTITLLLVASLTVMSGATIAPALPGIEAQFAATAHVELLTRLVLTLPALFIALGAPLAGVLADRFGRRHLLLFSIVLYSVAGASGLVVDQLGALLVGRALLGLAVAGTMTVATPLAADYFAGAERDRYMGLQMTAIGLGGLVFLGGGGLLAEIHWRAPFAIYAVAWALLPLVATRIDEPEPVPRRAARPTSERSSGWQLPVTVFLLIAAVNSVAFYLIPTQFPFHLQEMGTASPSRAGLAIALLNVTSAPLSLAYGRLRRWIQPAVIFGLGFSLMAAGLGLLAFAPNYGIVCVSMAVTGAGLGVVMPNLMAGAMAMAPADMRGRVAGGLTAAIFIGQFVSPFISQPWIAALGYATTFLHAGIVLAALALLSFLVGIGKKGIRPSRGRTG